MSRRELTTLARWHIHVDIIEEDGGGHFARAFVFPGVAQPPAMFCAARPTAGEALLQLMREVKAVLETK